MEKNFRETIVIALGGSLLVPERVDVDFLKQFKDLLRQFISEGYQLAVIVGGGKTSRYYHQAASQFSHIDNDDLDWIGIKTIHLNCELVRRVLADMDVHPKTILNPDDIQEVQEPLVVIGAWQPGHSSDHNAISMAYALGAKRVVNFSNTHYVYDKDPRTFDDAKIIPALSWNEYRALTPEEWTPNMSAPFDPIASARAQELGMEVAVLGASIENLHHYLQGKEFEGSVIRG